MTNLTIYVHPMLTRPKSRTTTQKSYKGFLATLSELQSFQLTEKEPFTRGYSFVVLTVDSAEPTSFKKAATFAGSNVRGIWFIESSRYLEIGTSTY